MALTGTVKLERLSKTDGLYAILLAVASLISYWVSYDDQGRSVCTFADEKQRIGKAVSSGERIGLLLMDVFFLLSAHVRQFLVDRDEKDERPGLGFFCGRDQEAKIISKRLSSHVSAFIMAETCQESGVSTQRKETSMWQSILMQTNGRTRRGSACVLP
jgi:hypothetical protein